MASKQHIIILDQDDSLLSIKPLIDKALNDGILKSQIVLGFDVDGTLTDLKTKNSFIPRGGDNTRQLFEWLNESEIKWFAISARPYDIGSLEGVITSLRVMGSPSPEWSSKDLIMENTLLLNNNEIYTILEYNNIISAVLPNSRDSYDKHASLEYAIMTYFIEYPKLVIFVDDNALNIVTLYEHFKNRDCQFIGILYTPHKIESGHVECLPILEELMKL